MSAIQENAAAQLSTPPASETAHKAAPKPDLRIGALRRFAIAITVLNFLGRTWLGFETSLAQLVVALGSAYGLELFLEWIEARVQKREPRYLGGGFERFMDFMLPSHITGLAISMLIYANDRLFPYAFASAIAIGSKSIFTAPAPSGNGRRHFLNPSNTGIAIAMLVFPWVEPTQPYQFTENLHGVWDWALPGLIICTGTLLNSRFTMRIPLIFAFLTGFTAQAVIRSFIFDFPASTALVIMSGAAFILYTLYMVSDPGTTPSHPRDQVFFGLTLAATYGILISFHCSFPMFFALLVVCSVRGLRLNLEAWLKSRKPVPALRALDATVREG